MFLFNFQSLLCLYLTYCYINRLSVCFQPSPTVSDLLLSLFIFAVIDFPVMMDYLLWTGHHHPLISFLRFWTHNRPFSDFPRLAYDIYNTTQPHFNITATPGSCNMCYDTSSHIQHRGLERTMCFTMLPIISLTIRISFQGMHCYIWYLEVQLQGGVTLVYPSC
jgi:hypothetical protein